MASAFIGLGSNLGNRSAHLLLAQQQLGKLPETRLLLISQFHETEPLGGPPQGKFLNAVAHLETRLSPDLLLKHLLEIEEGMFRPPGHPRWEPRTMDLDILSYDNVVLRTPKLTIPHPRLHEREFVLLPLSEIAPFWRHPTLGKSALELLKELAPRADHPANISA